MPTNQLTTKKLSDWLKPRMTGGVAVVPGRIPDMPNRVIGIILGSGPGITMEGLFDVVGFQITARGAENNLDDAEEIAMQVDEVLTGFGVGTSENFFVGDIYVSQLGRTGGRPSQSSITDSESRWTFTCSYFAYVSTNIGSFI